MTLEEKLLNIGKTSTVKSLNVYPNVETAKDFDELWTKVIEPNLPSKDIVIKWHTLLMKYIQQDNAVFSLRSYGSGDARRGFLNKVYVCGEESFETFYTDNSVPFYFYSMAKDGFIPSLTEFNDAMIMNRTFPYGYFSSSSGKKFAAYPVGKNPDINKKGYKLAHVFSAGENYSSNAGYKEISSFCSAEFPRGDIADWNYHVLSNGKHYRAIYINDINKANTVRAFAVAHFLRSVHPLNFFLVPNKSNTKDKASGILKTNIYYKDHHGKEKDEIGEYSKLIEYVAAKIKDRYKDTNVFQEFLNLIFPVGNCIDPKADNVQIDAEYAIGIWSKKIDSALTLVMGSTITSMAKKSTTKSKLPKGKAIIKKVLIPSDPNQFKQELLKTKRAKRILLYKDGNAKVEQWNADKFTATSDLNGNIDSQLWHRKDRAEITEVIYEIEDYDNPNYLYDIENTHAVELYIHYKKGWSSFRSIDEHIVEYIIENDEITLFYGIGFESGRTEKNKISPKDMKELLSILDDAIKMGALETSNTLIPTEHGSIDTYDYGYRSETGNDCGGLFTDDILTTRYHNLMDKITK